MGPKKGVSRRKEVHANDGAERSAKTTGSDESRLCSPHMVPIDQQQKLLDVFQRACSATFDDQLSQTIQNVKQQLFVRDFVGAFDTAAYRDAYSVRWSPTRALAYTHVLCEMHPLFKERLSTVTSSHHASDAARLDNGIAKGLRCESGLRADIGKSDPEKRSASLERSPRRRIVALGAGGGAEVVALAGYLRYFNEVKASASGPEAPVAQENEEHARIRLDCTCIDAADWSSNLHKLHTLLSTPPPISQYASKERQLSNRALIEPSDLALTYVQHDLVQPLGESIDMHFRGADLVTIFFTLNELYSTSIGLTTKLLLSLTASVLPGTLLAVIDSPGSYSTINVGNPDKGSGNTASSKPDSSGSPGKEKRYPMHWLLDHTLLEQANKDAMGNSSTRQWEKIKSQDSQWFRLPSQLRYPLPLEDMRYQSHVYRRL